jgi:hypothetical protein
MIPRRSTRGTSGHKETKKELLKTFVYFVAFVVKLFLPIIAKLMFRVHPVKPDFRMAGCAG